ncbi:MAG: acetyl-CoA carboxylase carboxyltransferase subunit beta [Thermoleophilia bacterium]
MSRRPISVSIDRLRGRRPDAAPPRRMPGDERSCPKCQSHFGPEEMRRNRWVCATCGHHFNIGARDRLDALADGGAWTPIGEELRATDPLRFVDLQPYPDRVTAAEAKGNTEALLCAELAVSGQACVVAVMDFGFLGGSMGSVVGERFARAADRAVQLGVPMITITSSGGARMQEGVLALMQMAKTIVSLDELADAGLPFIVVLAHPTTGGVWASFASLGDVTYAEPGALIAFSGPRVIEQTTREKLPDDFGLAEQQLLHGHVDAVVDRRELPERLGRLMRILHQPPRDGLGASLAVQLAQNGTERAARIAQALPQLSRRLRDRVLGEGER